MLCGTHILNVGILKNIPNNTMSPTIHYYESMNVMRISTAYVQKSPQSLLGNRRSGGKTYNIKY